MGRDGQGPLALPASASQQRLALYPLLQLEATIVAAKAHLPGPHTILAGDDDRRLALGAGPNAIPGDAPALDGSLGAAEAGRGALEIEVIDAQLLRIPAGG